MKRITATLLLVSSLFIVTVFGQEKGSKKIFIIGNSFSGNASRYLPQLAKEGGYELLLGRAELGGCSLERHWKAVAAYEADSTAEAGRPYKGKSLKMLLSQGTWDVITIQQYSFLSSNLPTFSPFAKDLYDYVKKIQPQAEVIIHQTWAYRKDAKGFSTLPGDQKAKDQEEMWQQSRAAYQTVAKDLDIRIMPVGDAFWSVDSDKKIGYKKDLTFDAEKAKYPALPNQKNSLHVGYHWNKDQKLAFDANHASAAGCYLGGLIWYSTIFNESPKKVRFVPNDVDASFAKKLRKKAALVVR